MHCSKLLSIQLLLIGAGQQRSRNLDAKVVFPALGVTNGANLVGRSTAALTVFSSFHPV
jgi:hypothetical protein